MTVRTTGPVDKDFVEGVVDNWHLEAFNRSEVTLTVDMNLFDLAFQPPRAVGSASITLTPRQWGCLTLSSQGAEHTMVEVEHVLGGEDVLMNVYGRNSDNAAIAGASFPHRTLIDLV